jgi:hypothetical protein
VASVFFLLRGVMGGMRRSAAMTHPWEMHQHEQASAWTVRSAAHRYAGEQVPAS